MRINKLRNNCTLKAVKYVTRKSDKAVIEAFKNNGYRYHKGMYRIQWIKAAKELGCVLEPVNIVQDAGKTTAHKYMTLAQFIKNYPKGRYFISIKGHALVIAYGKIIDPNFNNKQGLKNRVRNADKILKVI